MEKIDKLLKRYLKRKVKMTTAVLVAFLISGSLSFASGGASGIADVVGDDLTDLYLEPGTYTPDEEGNINMTLIHRQAGNPEDTPDEYKYNMPEEEYNKLSDHDKELLQKRRVTIKNVVSKDKMTGNVTSSTLTITNGEKRLYGSDELTVELKEKSIGKEHLTDELYNELKNAAGGSTNSANITSTTLNVTDAADGSGKNIELKDNTVATSHLVDNAVTENKIANDAVTADKIAANAVTENKLATNSVTTGKIQDGAVIADKLGSNSVTTEKISDGNVTESKLATNSVTTGKIQDGAVTTDKLGASSVTGEKIQDGVISKDKLNTALKEEIDGKVNKTEMTGDVTSTTLTITNGENRLFGDSNLTVELKNDTVDTAHLKDNAVTADKIAANAVTENKIANDAVTSAKIQDGAVSKDKLSEALRNEIDGKVNRTEFTGDITSNTITVTGGTDKLLGDVKLEVADGAITADKLATNAVTENKIANDAVTSAKIQDGAVTKEKLSNSLKTKIAEIDNKANIDATNIDTDKYISKLNEGVNIDTPTGKLVKDSDLKKHLDLNYYTKSEVDRISSKSDVALSGVANAVAMANLPQVSSYNDYRHMVSAAYGNYEGQSAISVGLSGISQNNRVTYKVSGSLNTKGKLALGAGIGVMIGKVKTPTIEMPTSIKDKLEKSEKERQEMQVKLSEQKEMVNKQAEQIKDLYEIIKGLKEELKKR